jgi:hypothetical protein
MALRIRARLPTTDLFGITKDRVQHEYARIEEALCWWAGLPRRLGVEFSDTLLQTFWDKREFGRGDVIAHTPYKLLREAIVRVLDETATICRDHALLPEAYIDEASLLLQGLVESVYDDMVRLEARLTRRQNETQARRVASPSERRKPPVSLHEKVRQLKACRQFEIEDAGSALTVFLADQARGFKLLGSRPGGQDQSTKSTPTERAGRPKCPTEPATGSAAAVGALSDADEEIRAELMIEAKEEEGKYDVFLSYNSKERAAVEDVARRLKGIGIRPWFDKWVLVPGQSWVKALQNAIPRISCVAVFLGPAGIGPWQQEETEGFLIEFVSQGTPVIPVLLPGVDGKPELPTFLKTKTWADMRQWKEEGNDTFDRLVCGVIGRPPGEVPQGGLTARDVFEWQNKCR